MIIFKTIIVATFYHNIIILKYNNNDVLYEFNTNTTNKITALIIKCFPSENSLKYIDIISDFITPYKIIKF